MALNNLFSSTIQAVSGVAQAINQLSLPVQRTPIDDQIESACNPNRYEPDLARNLEICDIINTKGGSYPRDAAMSIVRLVNNRNDNVSSLALELLDICVKNCGFPFQLQVASKEFLNELVKRFPEKPPLVYPRNQRRILELINQWQLTFVQNGKYKDDLRHIGDMYRLLLSKGYRFPGVAQSQVAVLTQPAETLRSADEMEEEDTIVKKAKLQELLRRARPGDLEEANRLMKELVGEEGQVDYKAKEREELDRIEDKTKMLESVLQGIGTAAELHQADGVEDLFIQCKAAQVKVVKLIESREDDDHLQRLLNLNDLLNRVVQRYSTIEHGGPVSPAPQQSSLISLSPTTSPHAKPAQAPAGPVNVMDDLLGLSFGGVQAGSGGIAPPSYQLTAGGNGSMSLLDEGAIFLGNNSPVRGMSPHVTSMTPPLFGASSSPPTVSTASPPNTGAIDILGLATPPTSAGTPTAATSSARSGSPATHHSRPGHVDVYCAFSNRTLTPILSLSWQVAASKGVTLRMEPLSAQVLPPSSTNGAFNKFGADFDPATVSLTDAKVKFRLGFMSNGVNLEQEGVFSLVPSS
ncbi:hypothetical protein BCR44DRAFT_1427520 [Catenaria anguillulae PL171]|uniref:VHS domain-domain-containing protein n=1 Tax=Catenaria anguillulae PL171 TaxID=765915 RepID=A0A1Y2HZU4_9FUNG|nr:hypothetical protein BCR44DRAFT_1427520 [Catenaria anguillulae PL171]